MSKQQNKGKGRRIGHVGQAYLEAVEKKRAEQRAKNLQAMSKIKSA